MTIAHQTSVISAQISGALRLEISCSAPKDIVMMLREKLRCQAPIVVLLSSDGDSIDIE